MSRVVNADHSEWRNSICKHANRFYYFFTCWIESLARSIAMAVSGVLLRAVTALSARCRGCVVQGRGSLSVCCRLDRPMTGFSRSMTFSYSCLQSIIDQGAAGNNDRWVCASQFGHWDRHINRHVRRRLSTQQIAPSSA